MVQLCTEQVQLNVIDFEEPDDITTFCDEIFLVPPGCSENEEFVRYSDEVAPDWEYPGEYLVEECTDALTWFQGDAPQWMREEVEQSSAPPLATSIIIDGPSTSHQSYAYAINHGDILNQPVESTQLPMQHENNNHPMVHNAFMEHVQHDLIPSPPPPLVITPSFQPPALKPSSSPRQSSEPPDAPPRLMGLGRGRSRHKGPPSAVMSESLGPLEASNFLQDECDLVENQSRRQPVQSTFSTNLNNHGTGGSRMFATALNSALGPLGGRNSSFGGGMEKNGAAVVSSGGASALSYRRRNLEVTPGAGGRLCTITTNPLSMGNPYAPVHSPPVDERQSATARTQPTATRSLNLLGLGRGRRVLQPPPGLPP